MPSAYRYGTVSVVHADGGIDIHLDNGRDLHVSATQLQQQRVQSLRPGARLRLRLDNDAVTSIILLTQSGAASGQAQRIPARITGLFPAQKLIHIESELGTGEFSHVELSPTQWAALRVGSAAHLLRHPDGKVELELPRPESAPASTATDLQPAAGEEDPPRAGVITHLGAFHGAVKADDGSDYGYMRAAFPTLSARVGDRVLFRAGSADIARLTVTEKAAGGSGGPDPCNSRLQQILTDTRRPAIRDLVARLCEEGRLEWHWLTPPEDARRLPAQEQLTPEVLSAIRRAEPGFQDLFHHQAEALAALQNGRHVLVQTPTASGKTFCYNPAVFAALQKDPSTRALYIFPLNALLLDQLDKLEAMARAFSLSGSRPLRVGRLIGKLEADERNALIQDPPHIIAANPEMLSWLLGRTTQGGVAAFFRRLRYVVLDEAHSYRSLLGLHMAALVRRLLLVCQRQGNPGPQFVLSSATIGDAESLASRLTAQPIERFRFIGEDEDGSPHQPRHWMVLDPSAGVYGSVLTQHLDQAALTLVDALTVRQTEPLKTILFVRSFRELHYVDRMVKQFLTDRRRDDLIPQIEQYAGGLLSVSQKQRVFEKLKQGDFAAVITTNALEAGIDISALDVCILAGFPQHVARMRQMAGRAGRKKEGAVIYVPDLRRSVDHFYATHPERLLTQPPEAFVIDHENPYIGRRHVVTAAATLPGGVLERELQSFGRHLGRMIDEACEAGALEVVAGEPGNRMLTARPPAPNSPWAVNNMRAGAQDPYVLCKASGGPGMCTSRGCLAGDRQSNEAANECPDKVQILDREYVYREAHPGAVFEDIEGHLYEAVGIDEQQKWVGVRPLPDDTLRRTLPQEEIDVTLGREWGRRALANGAQLVWGEATVTRSYVGYGVYYLVPRRRCVGCGASFPDADENRTCPNCQSQTRPYLNQTKPEYFSFPSPYEGRVFRIRLNTIACWLVLPSALDDALASVAPCPLKGAQNRVNQLLKTTPAFKSADDFRQAAGVSQSAAQTGFDYLTKWGNLLRQRKPRKDHVATYPAIYGQCLCYALRQALPESEALPAFAQATGYPAVDDSRHICRRCFSGVLPLAAHTLEHVVALNYPTEVLGDSQDIGSVTFVMHPQTRNTTVVWYDNHNGGIGASEKIYERFEHLARKALDGLGCVCHSEEGCPLCIQMSKCDRNNSALNKTAATALARKLFGMPDYIPESPHYERIHQSRRQEEQADTEQPASEFAAGPVPRPSETAATLDPYQLLRVQPYVHDKVLNRALDIRGEETARETPPLSVRELQEAYEKILHSQRPAEWQFPPERKAYETLHVQPSASTRLVHSAYKAIITSVHPDVNPERRAWATEAAQRVNAAWEEIQKQRKSAEEA